MRSQRGNTLGRTLQRAPCSGSATTIDRLENGKFLLESDDDLQGYARVDLMLEVHRLLAVVDQSPGLPAAIYY